MKIPTNMTQEQKELLFKDLCARLPYRVKGQYLNSDDPLLRAATISYGSLDKSDGMVMDGSLVPWLFPPSSMTEEQKYDFYCRFIENDCNFDDFKEFYLDNGMWHKLLTSLDDIGAIIDWFHKNHFDYRGLIPMGLAIDATGLNIY